MSKIVFRAVIEVAGKPKEHIEETLQNYVETLRKDDRYKIVREVFADVKKHEDAEDFWACFAEVEVETEDLVHLTHFGFEFMPAMIEVIEPQELKFSQTEFSEYLSDLQLKLHEVDMIAKQVKMENDSIKLNMTGLLGNYVRVLLHQGNKTSEQLSGITGVHQDLLEDFLDKMIDDGKIDLKEGIYFLK
ncbi:hypothetical protein HQ489_00590 [Candidatus Woesearchaeota archaeon]|nr:hypothetical protein [Candidatus Woesearchaeota archaeon]